MFKPELDHAPGCFGSAMAFRDDKLECQTCQFREKCEPISVQRLKDLRDKFRIKVREKKKVGERRVTTSATTNSILPKDVEIKVNELKGLGVDIKTSLINGINPFTKSKLVQFNIACHLMLHMQSIDRSILSKAFQSKLNMSLEDSIFSSISTIRALDHIDVIQEDNGSIKIKDIA